MNRKRKIIVSITGIFLVLMILVGLTYAYFLTKITGNTNEKSISVTTANLVLEYGENTNVVQGISNAEPGYSVEKIFTATNKGNSTVTYGAALESIVNGLSRQEDLVYTLTCTSYLKKGFSLSSDGSITGTVDGTCSGVSTETKFPSTSDLSIMVNNTIDTTHTQAYKLTVTYKEMNVDQSVDMNKTFSAKINIVDLNAVARNNPYEDNKNSLAYHIINNAINNANGTELVGIPKTEVAEEINAANEKILSIALDDYGTSYYYRGGVEDNYVNFAGMCWKIVRIQGDGSVKLILEDQDNTCESTDGNWNIPTTTGGTIKVGNFGYTQYAANSLTDSNGNKNTLGRLLMNYLSGETENNKSMATTFKNFQTGPLANYLSHLKSGDWCFDDKAYATSNDNTTSLTSQEILDKQVEGTAFYYDSYVRLKGKIIKDPTLKCKGANMNKFGDNATEMYVGTLTLDEAVYAGIKFNTENSNNYLINQYQRNSSYPEVIVFFTLSPAQFNDFTNGESVFVVNDNGSFSDKIFYGDGEMSFRPAVQLKSNIQIIGGNGTKENPYTVK